MNGNRNAVFTVLLISICFSAPALKAEPLLKDDAYKMGEIICQMIAANGKKRVDTGMRSFFQNCMISVNQTLSKAQTTSVLKRDEPAAPAAASTETPASDTSDENKPRIYENFVDSKFLFEAIQRLCSADRYEKAAQVGCFKRATLVLQKHPAMAPTLSCNTPECFESTLHCEVSFSLLMSSIRERKTEMELMISNRGYPISVAFFRWLEIATAEVTAENAPQARACLRASYAFHENLDKKADRAEILESTRLVLASLQTRYRERTSDKLMPSTNR